MAIIRWDNVQSTANTEGLRESSQNLQQSLKRAAEGFGDVVQERENRATDKAIRDLKSQYRTAEEFEQAQAAGTVSDDALRSAYGDAVDLDRVAGFAENRVGDLRRKETEDYQYEQTLLKRADQPVTDKYTSLIAGAITDEDFDNIRLQLEDDPEARDVVKAQIAEQIESERRDDTRYTQSQEDRELKLKKDREDRNQLLLERKRTNDKFARIEAAETAMSTLRNEDRIANETAIADVTAAWNADGNEITTNSKGELLTVNGEKPTAIQQQEYFEAFVDAGGRKPRTEQELVNAYTELQAVRDLRTDEREVLLQAAEKAKERRSNLRAQLTERQREKFDGTIAEQTEKRVLANNNLKAQVDSTKAAFDRLPKEAIVGSKDQANDEIEIRKLIQENTPDDDFFDFKTLVPGEGGTGGDSVTDAIRDLRETMPDIPASIIIQAYLRNTGIEDPVLSSVGWDKDVDIGDMKDDAVSEYDRWKEQSSNAEQAYVRALSAYTDDTLNLPFDKNKIKNNAYARLEQNVDAPTNQNTVGSTLFRNFDKVAQDAEKERGINAENEAQRQREIKQLQENIVAVQRAINSGVPNAEELRKELALYQAQLAAI